MPQSQQKLNSSLVVIESDGTPSQILREWSLRVSNNLPIVSTGSPEGVLEAPQYTLYIDETTPTSPVQYRKMLPEISGDRKQGWVMV